MSQTVKRKKLREIPEYICKPGDVNYVAYSDTDSVYVDAEPILVALNPNFHNETEEDKDNLLEKVANEYQKVINNSYDQLAKDVFNIDTHRLEMQTEVVIRAAYFRATRRYAQWITKEKGIPVEKLDIKGLEYKKSNFPTLFSEFFMDLLIDILKGEEKSQIDIRVKDLEKRVLTGKISFVDMGNPTSVKTLNKYTGEPPKEGEIFTEYKSGAPASVKASLAYNDLIRFWGLDGKHNYIDQGSKVKWVYLKTNPYRIPSIAFLDYDIPDKMYEFIEKYIDRKQLWDSILLNKFEGLYSDLQFELNLNPYKNHFFNLE